MKYGYYPGCSLEGLSVEYDHSIRTLFEFLEIKMEDLPEWICCGTVAAPSLSRMLGLTTPLWNVAQAKKAGFDQLITPCSACFYHFKSAARQVADDLELQDKVEAILELPLSDSPPSVHPLEVLTSNGYEERIKGSLSPGRDLSELKVVCYYGCHISRPAEIMQFDDPENPRSMDLLLSWAGVQVLEWEGKVDCCGAHFSLVKPDIVVDLCQRLFEAAIEAGAEAIVVACPMCHANLDTRQDKISANLGRPLDMPILYFSQVLGYALGLEPKKMGFQKHIVDPLPLMLAKCSQRASAEEPNLTVEVSP